MNTLMKMASRLVIMFLFMSSAMANFNLPTSLEATGLLKGKGIKGIVTLRIVGDLVLLNGYSNVGAIQIQGQGDESRGTLNIPGVGDKVSYLVMAKERIVLMRVANGWRFKGKYSRPPFEGSLAYEASVDSIDGHSVYSTEVQGGAVVETSEGELSMSLGLVRDPITFTARLNLVILKNRVFGMFVRYYDGSGFAFPVWGRVNKQGRFKLKGESNKLSINPI